MGPIAFLMMFLNFFVEQVALENGVSAYIEEGHELCGDKVSDEEYNNAWHNRINVQASHGFEQQIT